MHVSGGKKRYFCKKVCEINDPYYQLKSKYLVRGCIKEEVIDVKKFALEKKIIAGRANFFNRSSISLGGRVFHLKHLNGIIKEKPIVYQRKALNKQGQNHLTGELLVS